MKERASVVGKRMKKVIGDLLAVRYCVTKALMLQNKGLVSG